MAQLPDEDDTPFSLPSDAPELMPVDYPELDGNVDPHEAYDEGLDDVIDVDPYRTDDDPIKSAERAMKAGVSGKEKYTVNHDVVRRWVEHRSGRPAHIIGTENGLDKGGLYIAFEDEEPDIDIEPINWEKFFKLFEKNHLALLYETKTRSGAESQFYKFIDRTDVGRITEARMMP